MNTISNTDDKMDTLQPVIEHWRERIPSALTCVIDTANTDLYSGPIYTDGRGEWLSCFDEGAKQFDFVRACHIIAGRLDCICDTYYHYWSGCVNEYEPDYEDDTDGWYLIERKDIILGIVGRELAAHI